MPRQRITIPPPILGMNYNKDITELDPGEAIQLRDCILDGQVRVRNGFTRAIAFQSPADVGFRPRAFGIVQDPADGIEHFIIMAHEQDALGDTIKIKVMTTAGTSIHDEEYSPSGTQDPPQFMEIRAGLHGLTFTSTALKKSVSDDVQNDGYDLYMWNGTSDDFSALTGTVGTSHNSTGVGGTSSTFLTEMEPGSFLFDNNNYFAGTIATVTDNTTANLERDSLVAMTTHASAASRPYRGWTPWHGKGRITTETGSNLVTGSNTKFKVLDKGFAVTEWSLFRRSDFGYIGDVSTVSHDESLTMTGNAQLVLENEPFIAIRTDVATGTAAGGDSEPYCGIVTAAWAGRQWYANNPVPQLSLEFWGEKGVHSRVSFSSPDQVQDVDWSDDGDWFDLGATEDNPEPILTLFPTENALLAFKHSEVYAITGSSPANFRATKIASDGVWNTNAVTSLQGGAAWIGKTGVWFFDGVSAPINLIEDKIGSSLWRSWCQDYHDGRDSADGEFSEVSIFEHGGHLFVGLNDINTTRMRQYSTGSGLVSTNPDCRTLVINLGTGAMNWWGNFFAYAATKTGGKTYALMYEESLDKPFIIDMDEVFEPRTQQDDRQILDGGETFTGPYFYYEAPAVSLDRTQYAKWLGITLEYLAVHHSLITDIFTGREDELERGQHNSAAWDVTSIFLNGADWQHRHFRFAGEGAIGEQRDQYLRLRFYEAGTAGDDNLEMGSITVYGVPIGVPGRRGAGA